MNEQTIAHYDPHHPPKTLDAALRLLEEIEKVRPRAIELVLNTGARMERFWGVDHIVNGRRYAEVTIHMADGRFFVLEGAELTQGFYEDPNGR